MEVFLRRAASAERAARYVQGVALRHVPAPLRYIYKPAARLNITDVLHTVSQHGMAMNAIDNELYEDCSKCLFRGVLLDEADERVTTEAHARS
ncbi:unnamed protein product, partial [Iphiclides podalirius]